MGTNSPILGHLNMTRPGTALGAGASEFEKRLAALQQSAKQAGFLRGLGRGAGKVKLPGLTGAIEKATLEQQLAKRQIQTAAQQARIGSPPVPNSTMATPAAPVAAPVAGLAAKAKRVARSKPAPAAQGIGATVAGLGAKAKNVVGQAAGGVAQKAQKALGDLSQTVGSRVGGMQPGLGRRLLAGPEHATSSPLNPADLGKKVLGRAGTAGLGAGVAGGAYVKGEADAAAEAKRRASEMGFMQRLAFLMNPGIVNRM